MNTIEQLESRLTGGFRLKKKLNLVLCLITFILGVTAFAYKARLEGGFLTCFREMTCCGTAFSSITALCFAAMAHHELRCGREVTSTWLYYLRLSSASTGAIILLVVLIGFLPFIPASPVILRYDMINMHVIIPILTMVSFVFNDPPIGRLRPLQYCGGLCFLLLYTVGQLICILFRLYPEEKIPYFFLNIRHQPIPMTCLYFLIIYAMGYLFSLLFSALNLKGSWIWFRR